MNSILDIAGTLLYVVFRIITLPLLMVLHCLFALWAATGYLLTGIRLVRRISFHPLQPFLHLFRYRFNLGRRLYAWAVHKG